LPRHLAAHASHIAESFANETKHRAVAGKRWLLGNGADFIQETGRKDVPTLVYTWWFFLEEKWKVSDRVIPRWKERNTKDDTTSPSVWFFLGF